MFLRGANAKLEKGETIFMAGVGMILYNAPKGDEDISPDLYSLPGTQLNAVDGATVFEYIKSTA